MKIRTLYNNFFTTFDQEQEISFWKKQSLKLADGKMSIKEGSNISYLIYSVVSFSTISGKTTSFMKDKLSVNFCQILRKLTANLDDAK